jgi:hypothetical protein
VGYTFPSTSTATHPPHDSPDCSPPATGGTVDQRNSHPFRIAAGYVFHNGVIPGFGNHYESDTACFLKTLKNADKETVYKALEKQAASRFVVVPENSTRLVLFGDGWLRHTSGILCCGMI